MIFNPRKIAIAIFVLIIILILLSASQFAYGQDKDTVKVPLKDIQGAIADKESQIESVLTGKTSGNVYYLQGQYDILLKFREIGLSQKAAVDSIESKRTKQTWKNSKTKNIH